jgi:AraC-like DNA-binding protein
VPTDLPLYQTCPPYARFAPAQLATTRALGNVFAVVLTDDTDEHAVRHATRAVIRVAPSASVLAVIAGNSSDPARATRLAAATGLSVVAMEENPLEPALRNALTRLQPLARGFRLWLRVADVTAEKRLITVLGQIMERATHHWPRAGAGAVPERDAEWPSVGQMAACVGLSSRGLRDAFARSRLPSPVKWKIFARDLVHAVLIQRDATTTLSRLALNLGYPDSQALAHAFQGSFGVTPSFVRERLGWQWLALRWRDRQAGVPNRQSIAGFDHACGPSRQHVHHAAPGSP